MQVFNRSYSKPRFGGKSLIKRMEHVLIAADDFEKTVDFYEGVLGFKVLRTLQSQLKIPGVEPGERKVAFM